MIIEDESGGRWRVEAGDPARRAVLALQAAGYRRIVLPWETLRTGNAPAATTGEPQTVAEYRLRDCAVLLAGRRA